MLLFNWVVLWDCDRSSNFFSSLPFCTLLWKLLRVFAQGSLKLNPPPPHTQTHTRWNFPYICPPFFHPSLSLYSLLSAQNYKSQTGVHTHTILLLTHTHTLTAHALSGTDSQCCTGVRQRCMIEREFILTPRQLKETTSVQRFMNGWPQQRTFFIRPWKPRIGAKRKEEFFYLFVCFFKQKTPFWLKWKLEFCLWDYWELHSWALVMLVSCMIVSCWQEPSLCFGFPTDHSLYSEHSVWMKGAGAGNMSSGRFSHLLRGVWFLWQGEFKHWLRRS